MSRSNPSADGQSNPSTRFFEWSGSTGKVKYYSKADKQTYELDLPFSFIVLDQLNCITGYNKADKSGYWSNEVRKLAIDVITVRTKAGIKKEGVYASLTSVMAAGGKYTKSVYIAYKDDNDELALGNIKLAGSAISAWIEFGKSQNVMDGAIVITEAKAAKNGNTNYFMPVFELRKLTKEAEAKSTELDEELQLYLDQYLSSKKSHKSTEDDTVDDVETEDEDDEEEPEAEDGSINIADVPF